MKLLVVRDQHHLMCEIQQQLEQRVENITAVPVDWKAVGDTVDFAEIVDKQRPDYVLMLPIMSPTDAAQMDQFQRLVHTVTDVLGEQEIPLLFLSSASVYSGKRLNYRETDQCEPLTALGEIYLQAERHISTQLDQHIILRSGWLFSHTGANFLTAVIDYAATNTKISVNSAGKGCPTATQDIARVILAILLQIDLDVEAWGTYHYSSSDAAIGFQFIETILAQAAQYNGDIDPKELLFEHSDAPEGDFYFEPVVLDCGKLKDTFGIHQKPWRAMLGGIVKNYFNEVTEHNGAG